MRDKLYRLLRLRPGEASLVLVMGFVLLTNSLALEISDVVSVSGFISQVGVPQILLVWIADMVIILLTSGLQTLVVDRFHRVRLMQWMSFGIAVTYIALRLMFTIGAPGWLNYSLLYVLSDQQWLFFPLLFWVLASDIFTDLSQAKRIFPLIASFGFLGQIAGLVIAAVAPNLLNRVGSSSVDLLVLNALIALLTYGVIVVGLSKVKVRETARQHETVRETLTEGWNFVREVPAFRYLTVVVIAMSVAIIMLEFRFFRVSHAEIDNPDSFQTFYSLYRMGVILAAIAVQTFLASRIMDKLTLKNVFFILPITVLISSLANVVAPLIAIATGGALMSLMVKETVDESARKAFQALVPEERRGRVSMFMESYLFAAGTIVGCVITGLTIILADRFLSTESPYIIYMGIAALVSIVAIWAVAKMRSVYDSSMLNWRLKRRQRAASVLDKLEF